MGKRGPAAVRFFAGFIQSALAPKERRPPLRRHLPESQMSRGGLLSYLSRDLPNRRVRVRVISTSAEMEGVVPSGRYPEIPRKRTRKARTADFLRLLPRARSSVLDIGARNGHFSRLLTEYFDVVTGLDLEKPPFEYPQVTTVAGDVTKLQVPDS